MANTTKFWAFFRNLFQKPGFIARLFLCITLVVYFIFGLYHLTNFISADEHFWLYNSDSARINQYWKAMSDGDWKDTRINDKPGITLAYTSGIALFFQNSAEKFQQSNDGTVQTFDPALTKKINFMYRLPILLFNGFFIFYFFWIIKKITESEWIALWTSVLILLSPILLGISQIVNPDSLFWVFGAAAIFTYFASLKLPEKKFILLSALMFGLALATKYVAIIFIPFFFLMMLAYDFFEIEKWKNSITEFAGRMKKNIIGYTIAIAGGLFVFSLLMPAVFVKWEYLYEGTIGFPGMKPIFWTVVAFCILLFADAYFYRSKIWKMILLKLAFLRKYLPQLIYTILSLSIVFILVNWLLGHRLLDLSEIPFDLKRSDQFAQLPYFQKYIPEIAPLTFGLTPFVLFALLYTWIISIFKENKHKALIFVLTAFYLIFFLAVIQQGLLVTIRYSIILFPLSMLLAAIGIENLINQDGLEKAEKTGKKVFSGTLALVLLTLAVSLTAQWRLFGLKEKRMVEFFNYHKTLSVLFFALAVFAIGFIIYKIITWKKIALLKGFYTYIILILISLISLYLIMPFYFSYSNDLLPKKYIITWAWGYGGYEAAEFINQLPDAKGLTVWSDSYGFCEFFVGKCIHKIKVNTTKHPIDYFYRTFKNQLSPGFDYLVEDEAFWRINIDGRAKIFVKIEKTIK